MNNIFNKDFLDLIECFNEQEVRYILIGGYSVIIHGYPRTTGDLDLWFERNNANYERIKYAFQCFKLPVFEMTLQNFLDVQQFDVFRFGRPPVAINIVTEIKGVTFSDAWPRRLCSTFDQVGSITFPYKT